MTHKWQHSAERKQWECLYCGATVNETHTGATNPPTDEHMQHAQQPGTAEEHLHKVRTSTCPDAPPVTPTVAPTA